MSGAGTSTIGYRAESTAAGAHQPPTVDVRTTGPVRILIVEKQLFVADALQALLCQQPGMVVVGNVGTLAGSVAELNPDIVILDYRLNDQVATAALKAILDARLETRVIFLSSEENDKVILAAIDAGASAVLYMSSPATEVIETIRVVAGGGTLIPPGTIATLLNGRRKTDGMRDKLTRREMEILNLMADGTSNREIATRLGISYVTVRCHVRNLSGKLAAHSRLEVLVRAQDLQIVDRRGPTRTSFA